MLGLAAGGALDALGDRAVDVVAGDPALIVVLAVGAGRGGGLASGKRLGLDLLDLLAGRASGGATGGLGEEGLDPGLVDEVENTAEDTTQEEVEEDAVDERVSGSSEVLKMFEMSNSHLRVKDAGGGLDDAGRAAVDLDLEDLTGGVGDDGEEVNDDVLGVHVQDEVEGEGLLLAGGNRDVVPDGCQVADDIGASGRALGQLLGGAEGTADEGDVNGAILLVLDVDQCLGDLAVDELDTKDVGFREGSRDISLELSLDRGGGRSVASLGGGGRKS